MAKDLSEYPPTREGFEKWKLDNPKPTVNKEEVLKSIEADNFVKEQEKKLRQEEWRQRGRGYNAKAIPAVEKREIAEEEHPERK
jgi:hypothetical protein